MTRIVETRSTEVARDAVHTEGMRRVQQSRGGGAASVRPHTASGVDCLERGVATNGVRHAAVGAAEAPVASPLAEIVQGHLPGDLVARVVGEAVDLDQDLSPDAGLLLRLAETAAGASALGEPEAALAERLCAAMGNIRKGMMLTLSDGVGAYTTADTKVPRSLVAACGEALATEKAEGKTVALQQVMLKNKAQFPFGMDINAFVQAVLRESYLLQNEILKDYADKVKFYTEQKKRIRAELQRARSTLANTAGMDDSAKLLEPFTPTDLSQVYGGGAENDEATDELGRAGAEKGSSNGSDSADPLPPAAPLLDDVANGYQATSAERILPVDASRTTYEVHTPSLGGSQTVDGYGLSPAQIQALLTQGKTVGIPYNGEYVLLTQEEGGSPAATYKGLPIVVELAADNSILKLKGLPGLDAAAQWVQVDSGGTLTKVEKDTTSTVTGTQERSFSSEYSWSEYDKLERSAPGWRSTSGCMGCRSASPCRIHKATKTPTIRRLSPGRWGRVRASKTTSPQCSRMPTTTSTTTSGTIKTREPSTSRRSTPPSTGRLCKTSPRKPRCSATPGECCRAVRTDSAVRATRAPARHRPLASGSLASQFSRRAISTPT